MQAFKLTFRLPHENNKLIIPSLLAMELPEGMQKSHFDDATTLAYKISFANFVPRHTLPEMIVVRNEEIFQRQMCQKAVLLKDKRSPARAMLEVDYQSRELVVLVKGKDTREYLDSLRMELLKILGRLNLDYEEKIRLPASALVDAMPRLTGEDWAAFQQVEFYRKRGAREFVSTRGGVYLIEKLTGLYGTQREPVATISHNKTVIIQNSRVGGSVATADDIDGSFNAQQAQQAEPQKTVLQKFKKYL